MIMQAIITSQTKLTPMLQQYVNIKEKHAECLLLFRLGDFYELFFDDALKAAPALDIVLTRRGKKEGEDIPMCGIPFHAAESYISRLIQQGFKVAICEQMESPEEAKKRGPKSVVQRDVVRIITPGTVTEENLLNAHQNNFLVGLVQHKKNLALVSIDISTGDFLSEQISPKELESSLTRLDPKEILLSQDMAIEHDTPLSPWKERLTIQSNSRFDVDNGHKKLLEAFQVSTLDSFGSFSSEEISAAGAVLDYIHLTQKTDLPNIKPPKKISAQEHLQFDAATRQSLELQKTLKGEYKGSLLHTINKTLTAGGGRLLAQRLATPLTDTKAIEQRIEAISYFLSEDDTLSQTRKLLDHAPDLERILTRLALGRGGPRDLESLKQALTIAQKLKALLGKTELQNSGELSNAFPALDTQQRLVHKLDLALGESPPLKARDGNFVKTGYHNDLDILQDLKHSGKEKIIALQEAYRSETGITSLKIKHNHVLGYYVEITAIHKDKAPQSFIHRQTLANSMRFSTVELSELEQKLSTASEKALTIELEIFETLLQETLNQQAPIIEAAQALAIIDVASSLAILAASQGYCRPTLDQSIHLTIEGGRHPVVENALKNHERFVPNACTLTDTNTFWLLTGPNMAGKSTFLRQNALIILMAQMGSYVPAAKAHIGVVDKIFSRVGAADELSRGHSTFMVEMVETASILNQATHRSFVILDEIGRGTSTYDGLSLAWATAEHLHNVQRCRTLFSTHYHELGALKESLKNLSCHTIKVKEWKDKIIFLHEVIKGLADRSYGIHVAKIAGISTSVIQRAQQLLKTLEAQKEQPALEELPLLQIAKPESPKQTPLEELLITIDPDSLTPKEALNVLYQLKEKVLDT